jgi:hypothetical protein
MQPQTTADVILVLFQQSSPLGGEKSSPDHMLGMNYTKSLKVGSSIHPLSPLPFLK